MSHMTRKIVKAAIQPHRAFGQVVKVLREKLGLTQEELGERCDLDRTYISGIERGVRNPTIQTIWIIAGGLEISPQRLIELTDSYIRDAG